MSKQLQAILVTQTSKCRVDSLHPAGHYIMKSFVCPLEKIPAALLVCMFKTRMGEVQSECTRYGCKTS